MISEKNSYASTDIFGNEINLKAKTTKKKKPLQEKKISQEPEEAVVVSETKRMLKLKTNALVQMDKTFYEHPRVSNQNRNNNLIGQNGKKPLYNGYMSYATRRKVEEMISVWLKSIELTVDLKKQFKKVNRSVVYPTFVTMTLPSCQMHTDNTIKQTILNPFIDWLQGDDTVIYSYGKRKGEQKGFGVKCYFWRAEAQKNTRIHFHLVIDKYVPWDRIRDKWNQSCERLGYVTRFSQTQNSRYAIGFVYSEKELKHEIERVKELLETLYQTKAIPTGLENIFKLPLKNYLRNGQKLKDNKISQIAIENLRNKYENGLKTNWRNPNSTDIHKICNLGSITRYVVKYFSKKPPELELKPNERKVFDDNFNREMIHVYNKPLTEYGDDLPAPDDIREYVPIFSERKIEGRIWGASNQLKKMYGGKLVETDSKLRFLELELANSQTYLVNGNQYTSPFEYVNSEGTNLVNTLEPLIGKTKIDELADKVGDFFRAMNGKIIPVIPEKLGFMKKNTHDQFDIGDVLKKYSPSIYETYLNYYQNIFYTIYGK